jgi:hypothetical protein
MVRKYRYYKINKVSSCKFHAGEPFLQLTTVNCLMNISDSKMPASYTKKAPAVEVEANLVFNNVIEINELAGTATLDFKFRLYWTDERIYIPELWALLDPYLADQGNMKEQLDFGINAINRLRHNANGP